MSSKQTQKVASECAICWGPSCAERKSRAPKIGDIPRTVAVEDNGVSHHHHNNDDVACRLNGLDLSDVCNHDVTSITTTGTTIDKSVASASTESNKNKNIKLDVATSRCIRPIIPYLPYSPSHSPRIRHRLLKECKQVSLGGAHSNSFNCTGTNQDEDYVQLNQYRLKEAIGQGSYGVVKLAYNEEDDTHYAMKILSKKKLMRRPGVFSRAAPPRGNQQPNTAPEGPLDRVHREIAILKKLDHPNVVKLVEVLDDPERDHLYLVFELLERGEVLTVPTDTPLTEDEAWLYFKDIVLGLEYLHYQKVIHRDLKPSNLLLSDAGHVKIADLGVCNEFLGPDALLTSTAGTPAFTPPEALVPNAPSYSGKMADMWSLGVTLFSFLFGRVPFYHESLLGLYARIRQHPLAIPEEPKTSDSLKDLLIRMLVKDPMQRIALADVKQHPWVTKNGTCPLPSESQNCSQGLVQVSEEEVRLCVRSIPKLDTLILIKHMLRQHSFSHPFRRRSPSPRPDNSKMFGNRLPPKPDETQPTLSTEVNKNNKASALTMSGRSHSAPGAYELYGRSLSFDTPGPPLPSLSETEQQTEDEVR